MPAKSRNLSTENELDSKFHPLAGFLSEFIDEVKENSKNV